MKTLLTLLLAGIFSIAAFSQKDATLKYNLELNKVYRVKNTATQDVTRTVQGNSMLMQTTSKTVFSLKPLKIMDSEMICEVKFDTMEVVISQPPMNFTSTKTGDLGSSDISEVMSCIFNRMCNSSFVIKMSDEGKVLQVMNIDAMAAGITHGLDSITNPMFAGIKTQAEEMVKEKAIIGRIEGVTYYLPGKEVAKGDKWDISISMVSNGMGFTQDASYKLASLNKKSAEITSDVIIKTDAPNDLEGLGKYEITIDPSTGWIIKASGKQQLKGDVTVDTPQGSMVIGMDSNTVSETVVIE